MTKTVWARHAAGVGLLAAALAIAFPDRYLGYDAAWAVVWGQEAVDGMTPSFEGPQAPTPHPLLNVVAATLAALFGTDGAASVLG